MAIARNATIWIRWNDFNATGNDDGLAIDDFSLTAHPVPPDPVLDIVMVDDVTPPTLPGGIITYEIQIAHDAVDSNEDASNVIFKNQLPAGVSLPPAPDNVIGVTPPLNGNDFPTLDLEDADNDGAGVSVDGLITVELGALEFGNTFDLFFDVIVDERTTAGNITNTAASVTYSGTPDRWTVHDDDGRPGRHRRGRVLGGERLRRGREYLHDARVQRRRLWLHLPHSAVRRRPGVHRERRLRGWTVRWRLDAELRRQHALHR